MIPKINLVEAKSILTKSGLPVADYVINTYNGCLFGCLYCYAAQIARWKHSKEEWGSYLDVKINSPKLLKQELENKKKKFGSKNFGSIFLSSVCDPYVGLEAKYKLTRGCLEILANFGYQGPIVIQTKSPLVTRDIDILKKLNKVEVGFTITSVDDNVSRFLEANAPPTSSRLKALKILYNNGINTYIFIGPILPYFTNNEKKINNLLDKIEDSGTKEVWFEHLNLGPGIKKRLFSFLKKEASDLICEFEKADDKNYRQELEKIITKCMRGRNLKMGQKKVIFHHELPNKK